MLEYLAVAVAGVGAGAFTGMVPGIHPNTVSFASLPVYFGTGVEFLAFATFVVSMSISHTFHDFLPAVYLGVAEAESALASLPGAEMARIGRGPEAFRATVMGGAVAVTALTLLSPVIFYGMSVVYSTLTPVMEYVLVFFMAFQVFLSRRTRLAAVTSILSAALGFLAFRMPVNQSYVLVPVFGGLYAVPALLSLLRPGTGIPPQRGAGADGIPIRGGLLGLAAGMVAGMLPGVGAATSTTLLTPMMGSRKDFLAGMGAVNTSDLAVSFIALQAIGKARSGAAVAVDGLRQLELHGTAFLVSVSLFSSAVAVPAALRSSEFFLSAVRVFDTTKVAAAALLAVSGITILLTGAGGLLVLLTASAIGLAARETGSRACCMSCLIFPAVLFYTGLSV